MKVLRSRKIVPSTKTPITKKKTKTKTKTKTKLEPSTPTQIQEPILQSPTPTPTPMSPSSIGLGSDSVSVAGVTRRRSLRLVSKSGEKGTEEDKGGVFMGNGEMGIIDSLDLGFAGLSVEASDEDKSNKGGGLRGFRDDGFNRKLSIDLNVLGSAEEEEEEEEEEEGLRGFGEVGLGSNLGIDTTTTTTPKSNKSVREEPKRKRRLSIDLNVLGSEYSVEDEENGKGFLSLRSGKRVVKKRMSGDVDGGGLGREVIDLEIETGDRRLRREEKGKGKLALDDLEANNGVQVGELDLDLDLDLECAVDVTNQGQGSGGNEKGKRKLGGASDGGVDENSANKSRRRYSREEKGKDKLVHGSSLPNGGEKLELSLNSEVKNSDKDVILLDETGIGNADKREMADNVASLDQTKVGKANTREIDSSRRDYMERFREIARENASRFAHFSSQEEEEENNVPTEAEAEPEIEDWPGPFSTAMKIIRDRETKNKRVESSSLDKSKPASLIWTPRYGQNHRKPMVPSLKELCLIILSQNADAIASLENVPDALKHKLSQLLCDSRRMNNHVFELLIRGSPTEVRLRDCSWLTEEQFTDSFQTCDTSNLTVLQLDQCGRCMSDYVLPSTLARSSNSLAALTTLSLSGACRLSDDGLSKLVSSASVLRSLNLSQCSLLTSSSIDTLADSLGSVLRELNLTDCQSLDSMLILPALKKFEQLQVLSLAGIQNVGDDFLKEFLTARGHNIKELVLADCVKLTDSSFKVISETCPGLCAIDLVNLSKLTDFAIGYLANGCRAIQKLKLCRNSFSDEAIAAFLETSGDWLKELSLNNVKKVGYNTAASLGKRSKRLHTLDLSWCRNLTDEAVGFIVDNCLSLRVLKLFGCTQITKVFLDGHSNPDVQIIGLKMCPVLEHVKVPDHEKGPLLYYS